MPPTTSVDAARRNPVGTHVKVGPGLVKGTLAGGRRIGAEALQIFTGNPRGWALANGDPAVDAAFRALWTSSKPMIFVSHDRPLEADAVGAAWIQAAEASARR